MEDSKTALQVKLEIAKLSPKKGDILVVRLKDADLSKCQEFSSQLSEMFSGDEYLVMVTNSAMQIEHLDEKSMKTHGWVKKKP